MSSPVVVKHPSSKRRSQRLEEAAKVTTQAPPRPKPSGAVTYSVSKGADVWPARKPAAG